MRLFQMVQITTADFCLPGTQVYIAIDLLYFGLLFDIQNNGLPLYNLHTDFLV